MFGWKQLCVVLSVAVAIAAPAGAQEPSTTGFTASYLGLNPWTSTCTATTGMAGREPKTGSARPVFLFLTGTWGVYTNAEGMLFADEMAKRGFVAASINYDMLGIGPVFMDRKARCVFQQTPGSAVTKLCARPKADCGRGIVVAGFSQGAWIAARGHNYDGRVRALYGLGFVEGALSAEDGSFIYPPPRGTRTLPPDRLRIVNGTGSTGWTGQAESMRAELNAVTGSACSLMANSCLRANGSGWYIGQDSQVADGDADHCYHQGTCSWAPQFDPTWRSSKSEPWALSPNLDWLAAQAAPRRSGPTP